MAIKWTKKSAINREIDMAERHTDRTAVLLRWGIRSSEALETVLGHASRCFGPGLTSHSRNDPPFRVRVPIPNHLSFFDIQFFGKRVDYKIDGYSVNSFLRQNEIMAIVYRILTNGILNRT